jgi:hypothetical protein
MLSCYVLLLILAKTPPTLDVFYEEVRNPIARFLMAYFRLLLIIALAPGYMLNIPKYISKMERGPCNKRVLACCNFRRSLAPGKPVKSIWCGYVGPGVFGARVATTIRLFP